LTPDPIDTHREQRPADPDSPPELAAGAADAMTARWILALSEIEAEDRPSVGNKAWYLSRLIRAGFDVPSGLAIGREAGLAALAPDAAENSALAEFWERLELAVTSTLRLEEGVAVRSSSPTEDTQDRSMAGQFVTVLHVKSQMQLRQALVACWKSAGPGGAATGIGVVIQAMV
jgi:phosphoenolpyruvate synthase/pyruvate phosphate dikinase